MVGHCSTPVSGVPLVRRNHLRGLGVDSTPRSARPLPHPRSSGGSGGGRVVYWNKFSTETVRNRSGGRRRHGPRGGVVGARDQTPTSQHFFEVPYRSPGSLWDCGEFKDPSRIPVSVDRRGTARDRTCPVRLKGLGVLTVERLKKLTWVSLLYKT